MALRATKTEVVYQPKDDFDLLEVRFEAQVVNATIRIDVDAPLNESLDEAMKSAHEQAVFALQKMLEMAK